jgi:uncharacterized membrane protein YtjA (UPF0391 family)
MMGWAVTFLIVALIAAILGFGGVAGVAIEAAKLIFVVALCAAADRRCRKAFAMSGDAQIVA